MRRYPGPMPPAALAVIGTRESGGNPSVVAKPAGQPFAEIGLFQLVVYHKPGPERGEGEAEASER